MINRRAFLIRSMSTASVIAIAGVRPAWAASQSFSGIIYTKDNPGKWKGKAGSHTPIIKKEGDRVTITTPHPMSKAHYIVRHTLVLKDGTVVGAKTFYPDKDKKAISTFELPAGYQEGFYATSFCNLHDLWVTESEK